MPVYLPGLTFGGLGYGGASYGYSPYGSGTHPRLPVSVTGGYGGAPYGYASYGSVDITPPRVTGAASLDGYRVEVFFNEDMEDNAALRDPASYAFVESVVGASTFGAGITATSVVPGTPSGLGFSSAIVTHTGSTLGGQYTVTVSGPTDIAGNPVGPPPTNSAVFYALGDTSTVQATLPVPVWDDGRSVLLDFYSAAVAGQSQALLSEAGFSPGVDSTASYGITTTYPLTPTLGAATQTPGLPSQVTLDIHPMTSAVYDLIVGPSKAFTYAGSLLPDDDPSLVGAEIGSGSSAPSSTGLLLTKDAGVEYGWSFGDLTGRMALGTTYKASVAFTLATTTITPAVLNASFATFSVSDGDIQVDMTLADSAGVKTINIMSGAYSSTVLASWDTTAEHTLSLIRNQKGDFYTVVFDGVPLNTFPVASATKAAVYGAGTAFVLSPVHKVSLFRLVDLDLSASLTLFTTAWNFIHGFPASFTGSTVLTNDKIVTRYGPLVRGWGDATPATNQDVTVKIDGGSIDISGVNPYVGEIYPTIPIPLAAAGVFTVDVDYIWFMNPAMELAGLNTRGLTLSTWDRAVGHDVMLAAGGTPMSVSPLPEGSTGATKTNRFPMGVALGPYSRPSPKRIGHKYIGWQKEYSALLNAPTTMLLNQDPHRISVGGLTADALAAAGVFNGQTTPPEAETPWDLDGVDSGSGGTLSYTLVDASSGPYGVGTAAFYKRFGDLSLETSVSEIARFRVTEFVADGVFTGVGFGLHDGARLVFVGALEVNGVSHVGVLKDATTPHLEAGWAIGPSSPATGILDGVPTQTVVRVAYADFPAGVQAGNRFRIATGPQAGTYTIAECGLDLDTDGYVLLTLTTALPVEVTLFGASNFDLLFEVPYSEEYISFRAYSTFPGGSALVYVGGGVSGLVADLAEVAPFPAQTSLLLPATEKGVFFWGSLSRRATSTSVWDLAQYTSTPRLLTQTVQGITALTEMNTIPEDDPNDPWYVVGDFGTGALDSTGDQLLLKATSDRSPIPTQYFYERVEPFITPQVRVDSEATLMVDSAILGAGGAGLRVRDTEREATVQTVWVRSYSTGNALLETRPHVSLSGLLSPLDAGWIPTTSPKPPDSAVFVRGQTLELTKAAADGGFWESNAPLVDDAEDVGLILDVRLSVQGYAAGTKGIGVVVWGSVRLPSSSLSRLLGLTLSESGATKIVELRDINEALVQSFVFDWGDGGFHNYRVLCDPVADLVVLVIDDSVVGTTPFTGFASSGDLGGYLSGGVGFLGSGTCKVTVDSVSMTPLRTMALTGETLIKTFGVRLREGLASDIDSYRLPRTDGTTALNSDPSVVFKEMDWQDLCRVRLFLDPTWGASVYRPDLPLPPTATGDFATETTDPSAAWINVEYRDLPVQETARGTVAFGSINPAAISQQRWDSVRYRVRGAPDGFGIAPEGMVLNRAFTLTSGEYNLDTTPETLTIPSRTPFLVYIPDGDIFADRVFVVQVDGAVVPSANYSFDKATQNLQFVSSAPLAGSRHPVTVTFVVGHPVTQTYLCGQPIDETVTVLNEGTPPIPSDLDQNADREVMSGGIINDPEDVLDEAESLVLNDPYRVVTFTDTADSIYADLQFCTTEDGDSVHITPICDGPGPGQGLAHIEIEGNFTADVFTVPGGPTGPWKGSPSIKGSATHFNPATVLTASGGNILGGNLGPGTAILYPNQRGPSGKRPEGGMGINQDFALRLEDVTPRTEDLSIDTMLGDNVPPTYAEPVPSNPDGVPTANGHGAAAYEMVDRATVNVSRLGPWGANTWFGVVTVLNNAAIVAGDTITFSGLPLTASAAPGTDEFLIGADAAETVANIRDAINDTSNSFVGLCHAQVDAPPTTNQVSISSARELTFALSNGVAFQPNPTTGLFSKRSLLGGGAQLDGFQFILSGGSQLPEATVVTTGYIRAAL